MMSKLTLSLSVLTSLALTGTALADHEHGAEAAGGRVQVADRRTQPPIAQPPIAQPPIAQPPIAQPPIIDRAQHGQPVFVPPPAPQRPGHGEGRWELLSTLTAPMERGVLMVPLPAGGADQLRLVSSDRDLDILAVELTYGRGRTIVVRPQADGAVTLDLGRGRLRSIAVRYANHEADQGYGRDRGFDRGRGGERGRGFDRGRGHQAGAQVATISVLTKDDGAIAMHRW